MKNITLVFVLIFLVFNCVNAQTIYPTNRVKKALKLTKQTKLTMNTKSEVEDMDMSQRLDQSITSTFDISIVSPQELLIDMKITAIKIESEAMGQEKSFDSQNPDDGNAEMGSMVKKMMKNITKIKLDSNGIINEIKETEKTEIFNKQNSANPQFEKGKIFMLYLNIQKPINIGDKWRDTINTKESNIINEYTYTSFDNGMATIDQISSIKLEQKMEQMGMVMFSSLEGKIVSTLIVDINTLIIKKTNSTTLLSGTLNVDGKKIPNSTYSTIIDIIE